jgi:hypothetical protein
LQSLELGIYLNEEDYFHEHCTNHELRLVGSGVQHDLEGDMNLLFDMSEFYPGGVFPMEECEICLDELDKEPYAIAERILKNYLPVLERLVWGIEF